MNYYLTYYPKIFKKDKIEFDEFLNNNNFFDVEVKEYIENESYLVARDSKTNKIIGVRKTLDSYEVFKDDYKKYSRFSNLLIPQVDTYYFSAIAVLPEYRGQGIGNALLEESMKWIPKNTFIFTSLMKSNFLNYKKHGFIKTGETETRILMTRFPID